MDKVLYTIAGLPGSGKSTAAYELREWGVYPVIGMGDEMKRFKSEYSDDQFGNTWETAVQLRDVYGDAGAAYASLSAVSMALAANHTPGAIVDGIRNPKEIQLFREAFDVEVITVAIVTPKNKRRELFFERGDYAERYDDPQVAQAVSDKMLYTRTEREREAGLQDAINQAEFQIINDAGTGELGVRMAALDEHVDNGTPFEEMAYGTEGVIHNT